MNILVAILMILGAFFAFVAALGVNRMPDFFMRMHASTKAGAFGATLMLLSAALHFGSIRAALTAAFIIALYYLTTPVGAQTIGEAAHRKHVEMWPKTHRDQLAEDEESN